MEICPKTTPRIKDLFFPLENTIKNMLILALTGRTISNPERDIIALPIGYESLALKSFINSKNISPTKT